MKWLAYFFLVMCGSLVQAGKTASLEARVSKLEKIIEDMEELWVERYGLIRRCTTPKVEHGLADCDTSNKMKPGTKCSVICNSGYIATPSQSVTECLESGWWSTQLQCEVPLVVVAGGQVGDDMVDSSIEVIDFNNNTTCHLNIPDMPERDGKPRNLHSLIYNPRTSELLVCNGLSDASKATCDSWNMTDTESSWTGHSFPNKGDKFEESADRMAETYAHFNAYGPLSRKPMNPDRKKGRYAAEVLTINNDPVILGGMVYDDKNHRSTETTRRYTGGDWSRALRSCQNLKMHRAFFCTVKVQEAGMISIGGFSENSVVNKVTLRTCGGSFDKSFKKRDSIADLPSPLSGHSCTMLSDSYDILVAGGSRNQMDNAQSSSYLYSLEKNEWTQTGSIVNPRFGGRMVTVGDGVYILGGKERNPEVYLNSIEQFDAKSNDWKVVGRSLIKPRAHFGLALVPRSLFPQCS